MKGNLAQPPVRSVEERNALVMQWKGLPIRIARHYWPVLARGRMQMDDAIQVGLVGLIRAADIWDGTRGKFVTFAWKVIRNRLFRANRDAVLVRVPEGRRREVAFPRWIKPREADRCRPDASQYGRLEPVAPTAPDPHRFDELHKAIALLKGEERAVITRHLAGRSCVSIGEELGFTGEWARVLRDRAVESLRRRMTGSLAGALPRQKLGRTSGGPTGGQNYARPQKLTEEGVRAIIVGRRRGKLVKELAREAGVSEVTVRLILKGQTWKHLQSAEGAGG